MPGTWNSFAEEILHITWGWGVLGMGKKKIQQLHRLLILLKEEKQWQRRSAFGPFISFSSLLLFNYGLVQMNKTAYLDQAFDSENLLVGSANRRDTQVRRVVSKEADIFFTLRGPEPFFLLFRKPKVMPLLWVNDCALLPSQCRTGKAMHMSNSQASQARRFPVPSLLRPSWLV